MCTITTTMSRFIPDEILNMCREYYLDCVFLPPRVLPTQEEEEEEHVESPS